MEWVATLLIVLAVTLMVGGVFAAVGARGPWPSVLWFFLILFFATWAIGTWVQPVGPRVWEVPWLTFLIVALLVALLIAAATPSTREQGSYPSSEPLSLRGDTSEGAETKIRREQERAEQESAAAAAATAVGIFFWIFLVLAGTVLLLSLLFAPVA